MRKNPLLLLIIALSLASCGTQRRAVTTEPLPFAKIYTSAWMQRSAEYEALCYQAYNTARIYLDQTLAVLPEDARPLAIVTDIDETILDNSPNSVHQGLKNELYDSEEWHKWCAMGVADTIPGALSFLQYAASEGVEVFYISNRDERDREGTLINLQKYNFPYADHDHLLLRTTTSNKDERRDKVSETHDIIIFLGDNLADFTSEYNRATEAARSEVAKCHAPHFGAKFIVLPNPNYGDWESALLEYQRIPQQEQIHIIKRKAKGY